MQPAAPAPAAGSLLERLEIEARAKDQADPPTSKVMQALQAAKLAMAEPHQQSGASVGARYCVSVAAEEHVTLRICEFPSAQEALAGRERSLATFKEIAGVRVELKRSTLLAVIDSQGDVKSGAVTKRALSAFDAL